MPALRAEASRPAILLFGDQQSGRDSLLRCLVGSPDSTILELDTKYYTAEAQIQTASDTQHEQSSGGSWQAVILLFDTSRKESFKHVQDWVAAHDIDDVEIRICIANYLKSLQSSQGGQQGNWLEDAATWCRQSMLEYIEVASENAEADERLSVDGELHGMARVREVLEAHMWPGLVMKGPENGNTAALPKAFGPDCSQDAASDSSLELEDNDHSLQDDMQGLEALMNDMAAARQRISALPDTERRKEAELMTMQLISKLGIEEDTLLGAEDDGQ